MRKIILIDLQTLIVCMATGIIGGLCNITAWHVILFIFPVFFGWIPFPLLIKKMDEYLEKVSIVVTIDFLLSIVGLALCGEFLDEKSFIGTAALMALFMRIITHMVLIFELQSRWDVENIKGGISIIKKPPLFMVVF